ncbi:MAG: 4Fe-4S dicluster domain-containing protein [Bacteroidales bacterium]|nr:4Fe-4S dicluster domain-containing protein [Bacteroidales bacterium]
MLKQLIFLATVLIALGVFAYSVRNILLNISFLKKAYPLNRWGERFARLLKVGFGQTKILRFPLIGFLHALVFWGFLAILFGSFEMLIDGLFGLEKFLKILGPLHHFFMISGDIFAAIILILIIVFLFRRIALNIKRFSGIEMTHKAHTDANFALTLILLLMVSLLGMNMGYSALNPSEAHLYPVSKVLSYLIVNQNESFLHIFEQINWWAHILLIFFFANYLPYSKHFHVFMSLPNVFLSKLEPLTQMSNMERVTQEVKLMLDPSAPIPEESNDLIERFGMKDIEDGTWKHYTDSLTCTQCGRCTSVCPANLTGKLLSPRKMMIDFRRRMNEKSPHLRKNKQYDDQKSLLDDYITREELWACTTCNACAQECPVNIDHPSMILEMRRYLFMEESAAPSALNTMSTNIENNGAPWQYPPSDRLKWADNLYINE